MMCFHKGPLVLRIHLLSVIFLASFFIGLCRICLRAKVCNVVFIIRSLLTGIDCVTKLYFLESKTHSFVLKCSPRMLKIASQGFEASKFSETQDPLNKGRRGNHKHKILNRPLKPLRFSFASIFATGCSLGSSTQSDCLASLHWKPLDIPIPLISLQQSSCSQQWFFNLQVFIIMC